MSDSLGICRACSLDCPSEHDNMQADDCVKGCTDLEPAVQTRSFAFVTTAVHVLPYAWDLFTA